MRIKKNILLAIGILSMIILAGFIASAQTQTSFSGVSPTSTYVTTQPRAGFQSYYGGNVNTFWPALGDQATCEARQDVLLNVAPAGCQPVVVRSDLLAEQNVPVFCQIDALEINPLVDVSQVRNIRFTGEFPDTVAGTGFHPARAAIRTTNNLLGSPTPNNIGYVVVILKRQPVEAELPDSVNLTLSADIDYVAGNAYGIGSSEFILEPQNDAQWENQRLKQSFWNGRYFVRLERADDNFADISIFEGDRKVTTQRVAKGQTSPVIFVPGFYCRAGLQIAYDGFVTADTKARIEVSSGDQVDTFDVYRGSRFLNNRCSVNGITYANDSGTGTVTGSCNGRSFSLSLTTQIPTDSTNITIDGTQYSVTERQGEYDIALDNRITLDSQNKLLEWVGGQAIERINENGEVNQSLPNPRQAQLAQARNALIAYKEAKESTVQANEKARSEATATNYINAISSYEEVLDIYPNENQKLTGQEAGSRAINLAAQFGKVSDQRRLIEKVLATYPNSENNARFISELNRLSQFDLSESAESIEFDDKARTIRLISISEPVNKAAATFFIENAPFTIAQGETKPFDFGGQSRGRMVLDRINPNQVDVSAYCASVSDTGTVIYSSTRERFSLTETGPAVDICGVSVKLSESNAQSIAKVRILPQADRARSQANFSVQIGIEKRAIELNPDKTRERIERINETVMEWEEISGQLGNVVTGLKTACFATSALLSFKNFASGLSGETLARQEVMGGDNGWRAWCQARSGSGQEYLDLDACYTANAAKIDADVAATTNALATVNQNIQAIQSNHVTSEETFGTAVDSEAVRKDLARQILRDNPGATINMGDSFWTQDGNQIKEVPLTTVLSEENLDNGVLTTDSLRSIALNLELKKAGGLNSEINTNPDQRLITNIQRINQNAIQREQFEAAKSEVANGLPQPAYVGSTTQQKRAMDVVPLTNQLREQTGFTDESVTHLAVVGANPASIDQGNNAVNYKQGVYYLGLAGDPNKGLYNVRSVSEKGNITNFLGGEDAAGFTTAYGIGTIQELDRVSYSNPIDQNSAQCKFYENEPYRGMPAIVPFDTQNGWYAATRQTLPTFGGIGAFDASGRVTSFWLCNVGDNGRVEFESGFGDDLCQQVNLNTGQPLGSFPGLSEQEARTKINQGVQAIRQAQNQFGNAIITVNGQRCEVGAPSTGQPGTQCQDFMSPKDCHLMFNVCDPVVCPSSRCDFGGTYTVSNVAQSGIIGSTLLCLPNIQEGIVIPVCLTGIQAGIDGLTSIMRNHRDCLVESLETGQTVGICDQIYSVYMCEFFWNQVAPLVNVLVPKIFELAYGQGVRGGSEYLTVQSAWQNTQQSFEYFTQNYAVNSIAAFQARSVEEVGSQFCKAFISTKAPTAFKTLVEPDSPPQFHAYFDARTFSDVTIPATSQYKVFYHIFAGKDQGVNYNVYLKSPPESSFYQNAPYVQVANGFIPRGEYASQTRDFTAPEGYKELCVRINNEEECGFSQVSTSFATNFLRDSYIQGQATETNIQSEAECISGSPNLGAIALNPNIQSGVEEVIDPAIYNRGIVRICGSQNPGLSTDPSRFVQVGNCGDEKIACWLDKQSVDNAITDGNEFTRNRTLSELNRTIGAYLTNNGEIFSTQEAEAELESLTRAYNALANKKEKVSEAQAIVTRINAILTKLFYSQYKAQATLLKGKTYELVALDGLLADDEKARENRTDQGGREAGGPPGSGSNQNQADFPRQVGNTPYDFIRREIGFRTPSQLRFEGTPLPIYEEGNSIYYVTDVSFFDTQVAGQNNQGIVQALVVATIQPDGTIRTIEQPMDQNNQPLSENLQAHLAAINGQIYPPVVQQAQTPTTVSPSNVGGSNSGTEEISPTCTISNARWEMSQSARNNVVEVGDEVFMVVDSVGCDGEEIGFEVYEVDLLGDDVVGYDGGLIPLTDGETTVQFIIPQLNDAGSNFELRFRVGDAESNKLTVAEQSESETVVGEGPESRYFVIDNGDVIFEGNPTGITIDRNTGIISATFWDNGEPKTFRAGTVGRTGSINIIDENLITCIDEDIECAARNSRVIFGIEDIRGKFLQEDGQITETPIEQPKTYEITRFEYRSEEQPIVQNIGVNVGDDLTIFVEHTCDSVTVVAGDTENEFNVDQTTSPFYVNLITDTVGRYVALATCKNAKDEPVGDRLGPIYMPVTLAG